MQIRAGSGSAPLRSSSRPNEETESLRGGVCSERVRQIRGDPPGRCHWDGSIEFALRFFLHELALPKDFGCISVDSRSTLIEFIIEIELFF